MKKRDLKKRSVSSDIDIWLCSEHVTWGCGQSERNAGIKEEVRREAGRKRFTIR